LAENQNQRKRGGKKSVKCFHVFLRSSKQHIQR
jgi:hypothetical protein